MTSRKLARIERIKWLMRNRKLWVGFPDSRMYLWDHPEWVDKWREIVRLMRKDGLIARTTYYGDVGLVKLIAKARRCLKMKGR